MHAYYFYSPFKSFPFRTIILISPRIAVHCLEESVWFFPRFHSIRATNLISVNSRVSSKAHCLRLKVLKYYQGVRNGKNLILKLLHLSSFSSSRSVTCDSIFGNGNYFDMGIILLHSSLHWNTDLAPPLMGFWSGGGSLEPTAKKEFL